MVTGPWQHSRASCPVCTGHTCSKGSTVWSLWSLVDKESVSCSSHHLLHLRPHSSVHSEQVPFIKYFHPPGPFFPPGKDMGQELWSLFFSLVNFFLILFFFNWSINALQCCASFRWAVTWISYMQTYRPLSLSSAPHPTLWVITEHPLSSLGCTAVSL